MEWRPRPTDTPARPPSSATHCGASEMAASSELRSMLPSSRRRGRRAVAAASFLMLLLLAAVAHGAELVELTLLTGAQEKGAVCLDGTPPGYHLQRGFGSGTHSWLIYLQGGAWCDSIESCSFRKTTKYCDGASFAGDAEAQDKDGSTLYFRGLRIWDAVVDELMEKGLASAQQALLSGCSAGGLATLLHCNDFYARFPKEVSAKCLPDAGFFLNIEDLSGERLMLSIFNEVVQLQNVREVLPKDCLAKKNRTECFFAAELVKSIDAPTLIVNSAYDSWQIQNVLVPTGSYPANSWSSCKADIRNCSPTQSQVLNGRLGLSICSIFFHFSLFSLLFSVMEKVCIPSLCCRVQEQVGRRRRGCHRQKGLGAVHRFMLHPLSNTIQHLMELTCLPSTW
ncbi:hypothetical protein GUJ93_ZPchr0001g30454 [Zizania palustris]|uniref:Pectin acetylesterase n=1 Tax=Zizania palustris TaxID=103762 RepID=A0A8J5RPS8_ZIZPA|nr:hypothetical protein GUJ93_ZPchr0001g30454 [Zizania palustris]